MPLDQPRGETEDADLLGRVPHPQLERVPRFALAFGQSPPGVDLAFDDPLAVPFHEQRDRGQSHRHRPGEHLSDQERRAKQGEPARHQVGHDPQPERELVSILALGPLLFVLDLRVFQVADTVRREQRVSDADADVASGLVGHVPPRDLVERGQRALDDEGDQQSRQQPPERHQRQRGRAAGDNARNGAHDLSDKKSEQDPDAGGDNGECERQNGAAAGNLVGVPDQAQHVIDRNRDNRQHSTQLT